MLLAHAVKILVGVVGLGFVLSAGGCATGSKGQEDEQVAADDQEAADQEGADAVEGAKKKGKKGKTAPTAGKKGHKKGSAKKKKGG